MGDWEEKYHALEKKRKANEKGVGQQMVKLYQQIDEFKKAAAATEESAAAAVKKAEEESKEALRKAKQQGDEAMTRAEQAISETTSPTAKRRTTFLTVAESLLPNLAIAFEPDLDSLYQQAEDQEIEPHEYGKWIHNAIVPPKRRWWKSKQRSVSSKTNRKTNSKASRGPRTQRAQTVIATPEIDLPPDWIVLPRPDGEGVYYYNEETDESSWTIPTE